LLLFVEGESFADGGGCGSGTENLGCLLSGDGFVEFASGGLAFGKPQEGDLLLLLIESHELHQLGDFNGVLR